MTSPRVAVVGVSGFAGGELARLLDAHPLVDLGAVAGAASAGASLADVHPWTRGSRLEGRIVVPPDAIADVDVVLLATPPAESASVAPRLLERGARVVDLSAAFRLEPGDYPVWYGFDHPEPAWTSKATYGLTERFRDAIASADLVANPGCFATAAVLALAPLVDAGAIDPSSLLIDGKTGVSGAGRAATESTSHAATAESVRPYRAPHHQHTPEIERFLSPTGSEVRVTFVPHLVPAVRGVLVTAYARLDDVATTATLTRILDRAYAGEPFVRVLAPGEMADTRRVRGSNVVELQAFADERTSTAVVVGALDNLVKGAAGQAVQNLNVMLALEETAGLAIAGTAP